MSCTGFHFQSFEVPLHCFPILVCAIEKSYNILTPAPCTPQHPFSLEVYEILSWFLIFRNVLVMCPSLGSVHSFCWTFGGPFQPTIFKIVFLLLEKKKLRYFLISCRISVLCFCTSLCQALKLLEWPHLGLSNLLHVTVHTKNDTSILYFRARLLAVEVSSWDLYPLGCPLQLPWQINTSTHPFTCPNTIPQHTVKSSTQTFFLLLHFP